MTEQTLRLFIALNLPSALARRLDEEQRALGGIQAPVKWVDATNVHLTLQFLGAVPAGRSDDLLAAIAAAARDTHPFRLRLQGLGAFPNLRRPRVVWAGLAGETPTLEALQRRVIEETGRLGFQAETRPFKPHITLGRVRERSEPAALERLGTTIAQRRLSHGEEWKVEKIALMRSELQPSGARYSIVGQASLG